MVLDSGTQSYERHRNVLSASPQRERGGKKFSEHNGLRLYSYLSPSPSPDSDPTHLGQRLKTPTRLKCSKVSEARPEVRRLSETCSACPSPCSWMRRSESTCTVNSSGRARAQIRSAASLPHIARPKAEEISVSRRSPCLLVALRPLNVDKEREKFFQSCYTYNPQFEYEEPVPTAVLEKYRDASDQFITQATGIIHAVLEKYGSYERFEVATGGRVLSKCQIWSIIRKYMQKEGCVGEGGGDVARAHRDLPTLPMTLLAAPTPCSKGTPCLYCSHMVPCQRFTEVQPSQSRITRIFSGALGFVEESRFLIQEQRERQLLIQQQRIRQAKKTGPEGQLRVTRQHMCTLPSPPCQRRSVRSLVA